MKKTKSLVSLLTVILVTGSSLLASCGDTDPSTSSIAGTDSSEISSSESPEDEYPAATVSLRTSSEIEVEVGATARIAGSVTTDADDATLTISVEDPSIVSLPTKTTGAASYTITGLAEGTTTVTLAATVNPNAYVTVQVTVIAARPALSSMIDTISNYSNYTIVTEGSYPSSSGGDISYTSKLECTENMLVSGIDFGNEGTYVAQYTSSSTGESIWGIFAADDGYCSYIYENTLGHLDTSSVARIKGNDGYMTAAHIGGNHYKSMSSMDDYFNGLQALNSSLFTSVKSDDNVYEIAGSSSDMNSTYAECMLMSIMDPTIYYYAYLATVDSSSGSAYYYDMAEAVTTTVTILDVEEVQFDFEVNYGGYIISSTATIQDVGSTEIDLLSSDLLTDISNVTSIPAPQLDDRLSLVVDAIAGNDYMVTGSYKLTNNSSVTFTAYHYYTEDYYVAYMLDQTNYDILANALGADELNEFTEIYYKDANGHLSGAYVTYGYDENNNFTATIDTANAHPFDNPADDLYEALGYLSSTGLFTEDALAQLSDYEQFFTSIGSGFWTTGETLTRQYGEAIGIISQIDREAPDRLGSDVFGIVPTFNDTYTTVESFTLYYGYDEEGTGSYGVYKWPYTNVGGAATSCLINDQYLQMMGKSDSGSGDGDDDSENTDEGGSTGEDEGSGDSDGDGDGEGDEDDTEGESEIAVLNPDFRLAR